MRFETAAPNGTKPWGWVLSFTSALEWTRWWPFSSINNEGGGNDGDYLKQIEDDFKVEVMNLFGEDGMSWLL